MGIWDAGGKRAKHRFGGTRLPWALGLAVSAILVAPSFGQGSDSGSSDTSITGPRVDGPGEVVATIEVDWAPHQAVASDDEVWLAGSTDVHRIDPATDEVTDSIDMHGLTEGVALTQGAVWVSLLGGSSIPSGSLVQIDPATKAVVDTIDLGDGFEPAGVAADDETLWVNGYLLTAAQMIHVDVPTRRARLIGFGVTALGGVAATSDAVWATTESGVARIDPATDDVTATVEIEGLLTGVAVTRRAVWVTNQTDRTIVRIDPATNRIVTTIDLGVRANAVAAAGGAVWVTNLDNGVVTRIDEATNEIADTVDAAPGAERLRGLAATRSAVWAFHEDAVIHIDPGET